MHAYMTVYACTAKGIFVFLEAMPLPSIGTFKKMWLALQLSIEILGIEFFYLLPLRKYYSTQDRI